MADFTEALKEHIGNMSPDELAATEARRLTRDAEPKDHRTLEARWDAAPGEPPKQPVTKRVALEIEPGPEPGGDGILRVFEGEAFKETVILTPAFYRLAAGGTGPALDGDGMNGRFIVHSGGNGSDCVSVDRAALAAVLRRERPVEMARASRLLALEPRASSRSALPADQLVALFTQRWATDVIHTRVEGAVAKIPSRTLHLIIGKDQISLTVRKEELIVGEAGVLNSALAAAILRPPEKPLRPTIFVAGNAGAYRDRDAPFLQNTYGTGTLRRLVLDVSKLKNTITALEPEARETTFALLTQLIDRAAELNRELPARPPVPLHPVAPPRRPRKAVPPPVVQEDSGPFVANGADESLDDSMAPVFELAAEAGDTPLVTSGLDGEAMPGMPEDLEAVDADVDFNAPAEASESGAGVSQDETAGEALEAELESGEVLALDALEAETAEAGTGDEALAEESGIPMAAFEPDLSPDQESETAEPGIDPESSPEDAGETLEAMSD